MTFRGPKSGEYIIHFIIVLEYFDNLKANSADFSSDSQVRADSPESVLFAKTSLLPLTLALNNSYIFGIDSIRGST